MKMVKDVISFGKVYVEEGGFV